MFDKNLIYIKKDIKFLNKNYNYKVFFNYIKQYNKVLKTFSSSKLTHIYDTKYYRLNYYYFKNLNNFFKVLYNLFSNNLNFLFLNNTYKYIMPYYNYLYNFKLINNYKFYFFIKKKFLISNNFLYFYKNFILKLNVKFLVVLDYKLVHTYFKLLNKFNLPIFSYINTNSVNTVIDYYLYVNMYNVNFFTFYIYNIIINLYFYGKNFNNYNKKLLFYKKNVIKLN